jgi:mRNA interferase MazF
MTGVHPCVVVQNDIGNQLSALTIVVAVTSNLRVASLPIGILLPAGVGGLRQDSVAHCAHLYTVDKARLNKKMGDLPPGKMVELDGALARSLGLRP